MSDKLTIVCGLSQHAIFISDQSGLKGKQPINVTHNAIDAVRDYMVDDIKTGESSVGYAWKRGDGKIVKLICLIEG